MEHFIWNIEPNILHYGSIQMRWYGLFFVGSFFLGLWLLQWIYKKEGKDPEMLDNLVIYTMVGVVVGARLMHCLAYEPEFYLSHPLEILKVWKGGLASHGGMLGSIVGIYLFSLHYKVPFFWILARTAIAGTITATMVRLGNFFNSEILGLPSDAPWAIIFSRVDMIPRHPVQLYEALGYFSLFLLMITIYKKASPHFATRVLPPLFLLYMFTLRFILEYFKTRQAGYISELPFTTGQLLSLPFVLIGIVWILWVFISKDNLKHLKKDNNL